MNNAALSVALATAPSSAFEELRQRPKFWFPLLLLVISTTAVAYWYYSVVDIDWFKDIMFGNNADIQKLPEAERAAATGMVTRTTLLWGSVVGIVFAMPIVYLLWALYWMLGAKVTRFPQGLGFKHWFAFTCWTSLPGLLSIVIAAIYLLMSDTPQLSPSVMQPLSLNELLLHRPMGSPGHALFETLSIPLVLSTILVIIGVRTWSQRSWSFSVIYSLVPAFVLYGVWAFFAFR